MIFRYISVTKVIKFSKLAVITRSAKYQQRKNRSKKSQVMIQYFIGYLNIKFFILKL